ncbi:MAG: hypothetical protein ABIG39_05750 [Candidatus Micrarchaeota archaeon]
MADIYNDSWRDVDKAFKSTCRVIFGKEEGGINELEPYLREYTEPLKDTKSINGKDVYYTAPYCESARFLSYDESFDSVSKPININSIKDIDSLLNAVRENAHYTGNKILGNSNFVEQSENVIDSSFVYRSSEILRCEYVAHSSLIRDSKYMFGSSCLGTSSFCIKSCEACFSQRCFETNILFYCSDAFYSNNCKSCHEILFCFDQVSKRHMIGNNELGKERYGEIKGRIVEQILDELRSKRSVPSLLDLVKGD